MMSFFGRQRGSSNPACQTRARGVRLLVWLLICALFCPGLVAQTEKLHGTGFEPLEDWSPPPNPERFAEFAQITGLALLDSSLREFVLVSDRAPLGSAPARVVWRGRCWGSEWHKIAGRFVSPPSVRRGQGGSHSPYEWFADSTALINLCVSPNNLVAATKNVRDVWVFDREGRVIQQYTGPSPFAFEGTWSDERAKPQDVVGVMVSDDGSTYAAWTMRGSFALMRNGRWEVIRTYGQGWNPGGGRFSYHGTYVVSGVGDSVRLGDPHAGKPLWTKAVGSPDEQVMCCDFLFDERTFVVLSEGEAGFFFRLMDLSGVVLKETRLPKPAEVVSSLSRLLISPDGRWLCACRDAGVDVHFLDLARLELVFQIDQIDLCKLIRARGGPCHGW